MNLIQHRVIQIVFRLLEGRGTFNDKRDRRLKGGRELYSSAWFSLGVVSYKIAHSVQTNPLNPKDVNEAFQKQTDCNQSHPLEGCQF